MIWPFNRKTSTETGAEYYIRDAAIADAKTLVDFKHRIWRDMFGHLKDEAFFTQAEATTDEQVKFWQSRISRGDTVWMAEDLRDRLVGTLHATTKHSEHTAEFVAAHALGELHELRYFYLTAATAETTIGTELIRTAIGDQPAITWLMGHAPLVETNLRQAGFEPLGEPIDPSDAPWKGIPRQAMVRQ
ncbi:hypothetical protein GCM10023190_21910 [Enteractinococcus fodinae]|uniref:N-acetyltransferase domain-containing protein n=1 Tax=Enteractinococcus fodinae TaxID=684663 RepID=A0ABU2B375_9MICC|nr:hypothetical protein [Enteractinococcus fodinae]MDR7348050.1 hypothetical protein [Enteractinococcus fodinae]